MGVFYYSGGVKQKETSYRLPGRVSLECVSNEPLSFMWTRSPMTSLSVSACFGGFYSVCTGEGGGDGHISSINCHMREEGKKKNMKTGTMTDCVCDLK